MRRCGAGRSVRSGCVRQRCRSRSPRLSGCVPRRPLHVPHALRNVSRRGDVQERERRSWRPRSIQRGRDSSASRSSPQQTCDTTDESGRPFFAAVQPDSPRYGRRRRPVHVRRRVRVPDVQRPDVRDGLLPGTCTGDTPPAPVARARRAWSRSIARSTASATSPRRAGVRRIEARGRGVPVRGECAYGLGCAGAIARARARRSRSSTSPAPTDLPRQRATTAAARNVQEDRPRRSGVHDEPGVLVVLPLQPHHDAVREGPGDRSAVHDVHALLRSRRVLRHDGRRSRV